MVIKTSSNVRKGINGQMCVSLYDILKKHNGVRSNGSVASKSTRLGRKRILKQVFRLLKKRFPELEDATKFKERHVIALAELWEKQRLSAATIQTRFSVIRVFTGWIGKVGMVRKTVCYFDDPAIAKRDYITKIDKSWSGNHVNFDEVLAKVNAIDPYVAITLEFMLSFGLRRKEALMFTPHMSDEGVLVKISRGAKGGRERVVPILTESQKELLMRAREHFRPGQTLAGPGRSLKQSLRHFDYVMTTLQITKLGLGVTAHGLRSEYAQNRLKKLTGHDAPIKNSLSCPAKNIDLQARNEISGELGHTRTSITNTYFGKKKK
jgi:integrase